MKKSYKIVRHFLKKSPYEMIEKRHRLPPATFESIKLVLAIYSSLKPNSTFVQIGAFDGQTSDPTMEYVQAGKLKCLLVEPIESSFQKLKKKYDGTPNVHLMQAAVSYSDGEMTMYRVRPGSPSDTLQCGGLASFDKAHLLSHAINERDIEQVSVPCLTLKSMLARFGLQKINILQIDTEGFDAEVIKMALALDEIPDCINFEHSNLSAETKATLYDLLTQKGYLYSHDQSDTLALHSRFTRDLLALSRATRTSPVTP